MKLAKADKQRLEESSVPVPESGCWLWERTGNRYGFMHTSRCKELGRKYELAHRVSYELHKGPIPEGLEVRHTCDVGWCVNPDHLELGTHSDNMRDMVERGRNVSPSGVYVEKYEAMREMRRHGFQVKEIAERFGVSRSHCSRITAGCQPKWRIKCQG